jgi:hypothetical protein
MSESEGCPALPTGPSGHPDLAWLWPGDRAQARHGFTESWSRTASTQSLHAARVTSMSYGGASGAESDGLVGRQEVHVAVDGPRQPLAAPGLD